MRSIVSSFTLENVAREGSCRFWSISRSGRLLAMFVALLLAFALLIPVVAAAQQTEARRYRSERPLQTQAVQEVPLIEQDSLALLAFYESAFGTKINRPVAEWPNWYTITNGHVTNIWMFRAGTDGSMSLVK